MNASASSCLSAPTMRPPTASSSRNANCGYARPAVHVVATERQITDSSTASAKHSYIALPMQAISPNIDDGGTRASTSFRPSADSRIELRRAFLEQEHRLAGLAGPVEHMSRPAGRHLDGVVERLPAARA